MLLPCVQHLPKRKCAEYPQLCTRLQRASMLVLSLKVIHISHSQHREILIRKNAEPKAVYIMPVTVAPAAVTVA